MNFFENWYTRSYWPINNTSKVSYNSEVWFQKYEKVLNERTNKRQTDYVSLLLHSHRRKLFVGDKKRYRPKVWGRQGFYKEEEILQKLFSFICFHLEMKYLMIMSLGWFFFSCVKTGESFSRNVKSSHPWESNLDRRQRSPVNPNCLFFFLLQRYKISRPYF